MVGLELWGLEVHVGHELGVVLVLVFGGCLGLLVFGFGVGTGWGISISLTTLHRMHACVYV